MLTEIDADTPTWGEDAWAGEHDPVDVEPWEGPGLGELPGSGFAALELDLASGSPGGMSDDEVLGGIVGLDRVVAWAQARQTRLLAEFLRRRGDAFAQPEPTEDARYAPDEISVALKISRGAALGRLYHARHLLLVLPNVLDAWEAGRIDGYRVRIIAEAVANLDPEKAAAVAARVLPAAGEQSPGRLRAALARAVLAIDPDGANARHRKARQDRRVSVHAQPEGMASLWAYLSAPDARSCWEWLTRLARGLGAEDPRKMDARRADLLVALLTGRTTLTDPGESTEPAEDSENSEPGAAEGARAADTQKSAAGDGPPDPSDDGGSTNDTTSTAGAQPGGSVEAATGAEPAAGAGSRGSADTSTRPGGPADRPRRERYTPVTPGKPLVTVVIPHSTLTGTAEQPGELAGYGPIPADLAREIAADAVWTRLLHDPVSGTLLDHGRTTYHPPPHWPTTSAPATCTAADHTAHGPRRPANWTITSPTRTAPRVSPTSGRCANSTTT